MHVGESPLMLIGRIGRVPGAGASNVYASAKKSLKQYQRHSDQNDSEGNDSQYFPHFGLRSLARFLGFVSLIHDEWILSRMITRHLFNEGSCKSCKANLFFWSRFR